MKLDVPMTEHDFQQMTLLANLIAVIGTVIQREKPNSKRRVAYSMMMRDAKRIENSIPGNLEGRSIEESVAFYEDMQKAVYKYLRSFNPPKQVTRGKNGRFEAVPA